MLMEYGSVFNSKRKRRMSSPPPDTDEFQKWLSGWGERYAIPYMKRRRLEYCNTPQGMRWMALWSTLYIQPYLQRKQEEEEESQKRQNKEREEREMIRRQRETEDYLMGVGRLRKNGIGGIKKRRVFEDPLDNPLSDEYKQAMRLKSKTIAEDELAANRWLREWRVNAGIRRQWHYKDQGYESMDDDDDGQ